MEAIASKSQLLLWKSPVAMESQWFQMKINCCYGSLLVGMDYGKSMVANRHQ
jgi:hypothetical protein